MVRAKRVNDKKEAIQTTFSWPLLCLLLSTSLCIIGVTGCGGSDGNGTPIVEEQLPPAGSSSNWDEIVWDQDKWGL